MNSLLENSGLAETEVRVYEALLELGPSLVSEISRKAGISRTLGYHVLERLAVYGIINRVSGARSRMRYSANHPRSLYQYVANKTKTWENRKEEIEKNLPELVSLFKIVDKPSLHFLEGIAGITEIYLNTLDAKSEIVSILDIEGWDTDELRDFGKKYNRERSKKRISERILILDTPKGRSWMKNYAGSYKYTNYRWIKKEQVPGLFELGGEINIYDDKTVIALLKKPNIMGIFITSVALSNLLKTLFELAWTKGLNN